MEEYITDGQAGRLLDKYAIPYLKDNKFSTGLIELQKAVINDITQKVESGATVTSSTQGSKTSFNLRTFFNVIFWIVALGGLGFGIYIIVASYQRKKEMEAEIERLREKLQDSQRYLQDKIDSETYPYKKRVRTLESEKERTEAKNSQLDDENTKLKDNLNRAMKLHPNLEYEIQEMKAEEKKQEDIAQAEAVNFAVGDILDLKPSFEIYDKVKSAFNMYNQLSLSQKQYIDFSPNKLKILLEKSEELKNKHDEEVRRKKLMALSAAAVASVTAIIGNFSKGSTWNFGKIKEAKNIYDSLDSDAQDFFDEKVKDKLDRLYREAKKAVEDEEEEERRKKREREEEERRRRMSSSSSFSSSYRHSTSHSSIHRSFSGHGGRSSGGGASRHF